MASRSTTPFSLMLTALETSRMLSEANAVMGMRFLGMAGLWNVGPSEYTAMIFEKQRAFSRSASAMGREIMAGSSVETIYKAGTAPVRRKTAQNYRRLSRNGARFNGGI
jgi:hypothetical protein